MKKIALLIICSSSFAMAQSSSPEVIGAAGDHSATAAGSVSWTIGEPVSDTYGVTGNITTKGFHQPGNISLSAVPETAAGADPYLFPNPVAEELMLNFRGLSFGDYQVRIYDYSGKLLHVQLFSVSAVNQLEMISLSGYTKGIYLFGLSSQRAGYSRSFRVIKS